MLILCLCFLLASVEAVFFTLNSKGSLQCFAHKVDPGQELIGAYVISGEKDQNVQTTVVDIRGTVIYASQPRTREGKFDLKTDKAEYYKLCFQSKDKSPKSVSFDFYLHDGLQEEKFATQDEVTPLRTSFRKVSRSLDTVYRNIQFYERRERTHRDLAEVTCDRVVFSAVVKMVVLALISLSQIYMLRSFFNNKRGITIYPVLVLIWCII